MAKECCHQHQRICIKVRNHRFIIALRSHCKVWDPRPGNLMRYKWVAYVRD